MYTLTMSDIQQTPENTFLWIIVVIFHLICLIVWLLQTVKQRESIVSDFYRNYNNGGGYILNENLYNQVLYRYKKCNKKARWFILLYDYVNK